MNFNYKIKDEYIDCQVLNLQKTNIVPIRFMPSEELPFLFKRQPELFEEIIPFKNEDVEVNNELIIEEAPKNKK